MNHDLLRKGIPSDSAGSENALATTTKESWVIQQDNAALQKEVGAIRAQVDAVQVELKAIRR